MCFFFVPLKRKRIKDSNSVIKTTEFVLLGGGVCLWSMWLFSPHPQGQLKLQCRHMLLTSGLVPELPSGHNRYKCGFKTNGVSVEKPSLPRTSVSLLCNGTVLLPAKILRWFACVPQRPCVRNCVPVLRDGTFKEVIRSWWSCPQGWDGLMWLPWEWTAYHKDDFVPKVGSASACFSCALPSACVRGWCNKKALPRCQDLVFRSPGFWKGVR